MVIEPGSILVFRDAEEDPGAWFVFFSMDEGMAAFDLTKAHPDIGYEGFARALDFSDSNPQSEKVVLLGGPERRDDALIILHEAGGAGSADSAPVDEQFSIMTYT